MLPIESFSWGLRVWSLLCFQVGLGEILSLPAGWAPRSNVCGGTWEARRDPPPGSTLDLLPHPELGSRTGLRMELSLGVKGCGPGQGLALEAWTPWVPQPPSLPGGPRTGSATTSTSPSSHGGCPLPTPWPVFLKDVTLISWFLNGNNGTSHLQKLLPGPLQI